MSINRDTPEQRYSCSQPGCRKALTFAAGTFSRRVAVERLKADGWAMYIGECVCPACNSNSLTAMLGASVAVASVQRQIRSSLRRTSSQ